MKALLTLISPLNIPFTILNLLGGVVSGIWLAVLGDWGSIGYGILILMLSGFILGIALMPSALLAAPGAYFADAGKKSLFYLFAALSTIYVVIMIAVWSGGVLYFFASRASDTTWIPILIWSYGIALGPWQWMAQKEAQEGGGEGSVATTFFAQIGYVVMIGMAIVMDVTILDALLVFVTIMIIGEVIQFFIAIQSMQGRGGAETEFDA